MSRARDNVREAATLAAVGVLLAANGCAAFRRPAAASPPALSEDDLRYSRALAHYAQGLITEGEQGLDSTRPLEHFAEAAELDPGNHRIYARLATSYLARKEPGAAVEVLRTSCEQNPGSPLAWIDLATACQLARDADSAIAAYRKALDLDPSNPGVYQALANLLALEGRDEDALQLLDGGMRRSSDPKQVRSYAYRLGAHFVENGEAVRAIPYFDLVVRHTREHRAQLRHLLGELYSILDDDTAARKQFAMATREPDTMPQSFVKLALLEARQGDMDDGIAVLQDAEKQLPGNFMILFALGQMYHATDDFGKAVEVYDRIAALMEERDDEQLTPEFYLQHGAACERFGQIEKAVNIFEACIEKYPDAYQVLNYLAYMWAERGEQLDKAQEYVQRALQGEPGNGAYIDTLAWVFYKLERYDEALVQMQAAFEKLGDDPTIVDHYGDVLAALGRMDEAVERWRQSYEISADERVLLKLQAAGLDPSILPLPPKKNENGARTSPPKLKEESPTQ